MPPILSCYCLLVITCVIVSIDACFTNTGNACPNSSNENKCYVQWGVFVYVIYQVVNFDAFSCVYSFRPLDMGEIICTLTLKG